MFVAEDETFAVFCFRGTESETLRDRLTSIMVAQPEPFDTGARARVTLYVRSRYYQEMLSACQDYPLEQSLLPGERMTALELAIRLGEANYEIYYTGHSLGGGLATMVGSTLGDQRATATLGTYYIWFTSCCGKQSFRRLVHKNGIQIFEICQWHRVCSNGSTFAVYRQL